MEDKNTQVEKQVLKHLGEYQKIENTETYQEEAKIEKDVLEPVLKSLSAEEYVTLNVIERKEIELTDEGKGYATNGSPEFQFITKMTFGEKCEMATMEERVGKQIAKIGFGKAMKEKWLKKDGTGFERIAENPIDNDQTNLNKFMADTNLAVHDSKVVDQYKKRKHLIVKSIKAYAVTKGANWALERTKLETELTA
jgi:phenylalanyl-tRNA synthetase alpha chain